MRIPKQTPKIFTEEDVESIMLAIKRMPYTNAPLGRYNRIRDKTIILLLYYCGLRPNECLRLSWDDIDFEREMIHMIPYNNKERNNKPAHLIDKVKEILIDYKKEMKLLGYSSDYLFPSILTGQPLKSDSFSKRFQKIVREAGLSKFEYYDLNGRPRYSYHPYSLRHTYGTMATRTVGIEIAKELLRHKNIESTQVYNHPTFQEVKVKANRIFK